MMQTRFFLFFCGKTFAPELP